jgi:hypothetical protein
LTGLANITTVKFVELFSGIAQALGFKDADYDTISGFFINRNLFYNVIHDFSSVKQSVLTALLLIFA